MHAYEKRMEILNVLYVYCTWKYLHAISIHDYVVHQLARKVYHFQFSPEFVSLPMWLSFQIGRVGLNCMVLSGAHMSSSTAYTNMNTCVHRSFSFSFSHLSYINTKKKYGKIWVHVNLVHPRFNTTTGARSAPRCAWTCRPLAFIPRGATSDKPWRTPWNCRPLSWWKISFLPSGLPKKIGICCVWCFGAPKWNKKRPFFSKPSWVRDDKWTNQTRPNHLAIWVCPK